MGLLCQTVTLFLGLSGIATLFYTMVELIYIPTNNVLAFFFSPQPRQQLFFDFFLRPSLALSPGWSAVAQSWFTATSTPWVQAILPPQPSE